jgi:hypothetical protein
MLTMRLMHLPDIVPFAPSADNYKCCICEEIGTALIGFSQEN